MRVRLDGSVMDVNDEHPWNAQYPMLARLDVDNPVMFVNDVHQANADWPMLVRLDGSVIERNAVQPLNAPFPTEISPAG